MPKKFIGENPKSAATRQRKKQTDDEKEKKKDMEEEDRTWLENDKKVTKRLQKKVEEEKKKQEHFRKRSEAKTFLENELVELTKKSLKINDKVNSKLTRTQISRKTEKKTRKEDLNITLEENVNRVHINETVARTIEDAISVLACSEKNEDKHPEKRLKAAFNAFEERKLKELKLNKPFLKLSQMKQLIFKEWQKSSENPMNVK